MKYLKMLGLAAIAALGLLAFVGAGTASATTLFTDAAKTKPYPAGTTLHATLEPGTSATLTSGSTTIATCTSSTVHGTTSNQSGTRVSGSLSTQPTEEGSTQPTGLHWGGCSQTTDTVAAGSLEIEYTSGNNGKVIGKGNEVTLGIFGTSCTYGTGAGTELGTLTGGESPTLAITVTISRTAGGFLCPPTGIWHALYEITAPHALYVGA